MKKILDVFMNILAVIAFLTMILGAAAADSERILIPCIMAAGGAIALLLISRLYMHLK